MKFIERNKCGITGTNDLSYLNSFGSVPAYVGVVDNNQYSNDLRINLDWYISESSGCIQLKSLLPLDFLYGDKVVDNVGGIWKKHHEEFADFIKSSNSSNILEIGGGSCNLAEIYTTNNTRNKSCCQS